MTEQEKAQVRPRVTPSLYFKLKKLGLTVDEAIELVIKGFGTQNVPVHPIRGFSVRKTERPPIDISGPEKTKTATFALG